MLTHGERRKMTTKEGIKNDRLLPDEDANTLEPLLAQLNANIKYEYRNQY